MSEPSSEFKIETCFRYLTLVLWFCIITILFMTFDDYGMSWDEYYRFGGGDVKLQYYQKLFSGESLTFSPDRYPGLFDLTLATLHHFIPGNRILMGHLLSTCFGIAAILGIGLTARLLGGWQAAFWSSLFIITFPRFYGHVCFNPKDIPFAATYIWGLYATVRIIQELPNPSYKSYILLGITCGLSAAMRIAGIIHFAHLGLALTLFSIFVVAQKKPALNVSIKFLKSTLLKLSLSLIFITVILLIFWPYAHNNLFTATTNTMKAVTSWDLELPILFDGDYYLIPDLPLYYWPYMFIITTPLAHLGLLAIGGIIAVLYFKDCLLQFKTLQLRTLALFIVLFAAVFPIVYVLIKQANLFDGIRHLLFVTTPLAVCAGLLLKQFTNSKQYRIPLTLVCILAACIPIKDLIKTHPYPYIYYNSLVGGTEGITGKFESDYWGLSCRAAVEELEVYLINENPRFEETEYFIAVSGGTWLYTSFFPDNFTLTLDTKLADFYIANSRFGATIGYEDSAIIKIERKGLLLTQVSDQRPSKLMRWKELQENSNEFTPFPSIFFNE